MPGTGRLDFLARRDGIVVAAGLVAITGLAWLHLIGLAAGMDAMPAMAMPAIRPWGAADFGLMFVMWVVMMVAMMTPSAAPMILLHAAITRKTRAGARPVAHGGAFAAGYAVVWSGFSALATALQWSLEQAALLSPMMAGTSAPLGGALLIVAGVYQLTPLKHACLTQCRAPVQFLTAHWRPGARGAFRMGLVHGAYCVGCCWALMGLLFVGGVMNLLWIAALAGVVLLEKIVPRGAALARAAGGLMIAAGLWLAVQG